MRAKIWSTISFGDCAGAAAACGAAAGGGAAGGPELRRRFLDPPAGPAAAGPLAAVGRLPLAPQVPRRVDPEAAPGALWRALPREPQDDRRDVLGLHLLGDEVDV